MAKSVTCSYTTFRSGVQSAVRGNVRLVLVVLLQLTVLVIFGPRGKGYGKTLHV